VTDKEMGYVYAGFAAWFVLVMANAMARMSRASASEFTSDEPREVYAEFYWGLILPVVAGSALFGLLFKSVTLNHVEWWGAVFFVLYFSVQHTRREPAARYGMLALVVDVVGIGVFFVVMQCVGLFDQSATLKDNPTCLFAGVLSVPILGSVSRVASGERPRFALSTAAVIAGFLGLVGSWRGWPSSFGGCMMAILIVVVVAYFVGNVIEDGGRREVPSPWLR
jgi:hypothetical protein